jgi:hypothetical protein
MQVKNRRRVCISLLKKQPLYNKHLKKVVTGWVTTFFIIKRNLIIDIAGFDMLFSDPRSYPLPVSARSELGEDRDMVE